MTVTFHGLWLLCLLGTVTFAAAAAPRWPWLAWLSAGITLAAAVHAAGWPLDPVLAGAFAAFGAIVYLFFPRYAWAAALSGGAVAGMATGGMSLVGLPPLLSVLLVSALVTAVVWLTRTRPVFAPEWLREDALLLVGLMGVVVAVLPGLLDGWQAAANLNSRVENVAVLAIPAWAISVVGMSTLLGAVYTMWSRR